jgi:hypothetical protein
MNQNDDAIRMLKANGYTFEEAQAVLALRDVTHMPPQLVKYWVAGAGAAKINWG